MDLKKGCRQTLATVHPFSSSAQAQEQEADIKFTCAHIHTCCGTWVVQDVITLTHLS